MAFVGLLDTNMLSALMRDKSGVLARRAASIGPRNLCTSIIVAAELRFGAARVKSVRLTSEVEDILARIAVLPLDRPVDEAYGMIRAHLQSRGTPIGPNDTWIAAHALALDLTLITANIGEFARVPGLRVENWLD